MTEPVRVVAAFDFDETLTRRDTLIPFLWKVAGPIGFVTACVRVGFDGLRGKVALSDRDAVKERILSLIMAGRSVSELQRRADRYAAGLVEQQLDPDTLVRLRQHLSRGDEVLLVSASLELYLRPAARSLGLADVIGVELASDGDRFTGELARPNVRAEQKAVRLREWLGQPATGPLDDVDLWAYGNSSGDHALLQLADHAFWRGRPAKLPAGAVQFTPGPLRGAESLRSTSDTTTEEHMGIFDNDRPDGYDGSEEEPAIHPEALPPREKLAIDAEDLAEFAEGYDKGQPLAGEQGAP